MSSIDERILQNIERSKQEERQQRAQKARDAKKQYAIARDRQQIIGQFVESHFPEVERFHPHRTHTENQLEFAPLIEFLRVLAFNKKIVAQIKEAATKKNQ